MVLVPNVRAHPTFRGVQIFPPRPSRPVRRHFGTGNFRPEKFRDGVLPIPSRPEYKYMCIYIIFLEKCMCFIYHVWVCMTFFRENAIIIKFYLIILCKMYYKSNIELIYLFFTNTKCHNFLFQVNNCIKNNSKNFGNFPVPSRFCSVPGQRSGWDGTRDKNSVPSRAGNMGLARRAGPFSCKPEEGRACCFGGKIGEWAC